MMKTLEGFDYIKEKQGNGMDKTYIQMQIKLCGEFTCTYSIYENASLNIQINKSTSYWTNNERKTNFIIYPIVFLQEERILRNCN